MIVEKKYINKSQIFRLYGCLRTEEEGSQETNDSVVFYTQSTIETTAAVVTANNFICRQLFLVTAEKQYI